MCVCVRVCVISAWVFVQPARRSTYLFRPHASFFFIFWYASFCVCLFSFRRFFYTRRPRTVTSSYTILVFADDCRILLVCFLFLFFYRRDFHAAVLFIVPVSVVPTALFRFCNFCSLFSFWLLYRRVFFFSKVTQVFKNRNYVHEENKYWKVRVN